MLPLNKFVAAVAILVTLTACQTAAPELSEADKTAIRAMVDTYTKAGLAGDWDAWGMTLTEDVRVSPPNTAPIEGRAAAVAWVKTFPKLKTFVVTIEEIEGRGDLAYTRGKYTLSMALPDSTATTENGAFVEVHRKQADGSWPYSRLIFHSIDPLPPPPPVAVKK